MMVQWQELVAISNTITLDADEDQLLWSYETNGVFLKIHVCFS
jgi:hypothetical protein